MDASLRLPKSRSITVSASTGRRVLAFILDILIIDLLLFQHFRKFIAARPVTWSEAVQGNVVLPEGFLMATIAMGIIALLYFMLFEYFFAQTIGMQLLGIKVGGERTLAKCALRNAYALPFFPFTILWVVEPVFLFWKKERLLERWSKTTTVQTMRM